MPNLSCYASSIFGTDSENFVVVVCLLEKLLEKYNKCDAKERHVLETQTAVFKIQTKQCKFDKNTYTSNLLQNHYQRKTSKHKVTMDSWL